MKILLTLFLLLPVSAVYSQNKRIISGSIYDSETKEPLAFASISLKKQLTGTISNETGQFDFLIGEEVIEDSLLISILGYQPVMLNLKSVRSPVLVPLKRNILELKEVVVRPMPPTYYIIRAVKKIKDNYAREPFETEAYYREKISEGREGSLSLNEAVFRSYYLNYQDSSVENQHQLFLYKQTNIGKTSLSINQNSAGLDKKKRNGKKKKRAESEETDSMMEAMISGPQLILSMDVVKNKHAFLDSAQFKYFDYSFGKSTTLKNKELMVIDFKSRRKHDHIKVEGKIYLDMETEAIALIDFSGVLSIPFYIRTLLFAYGISLSNPDYDVKLEYQFINGKWYPQNFQFSGLSVLTKRNWFSRNNHFDISLEGIFAVNKIKIREPLAIDPAKRFNAGKPMKDQAYNDAGISWSEINVIKR